jgi:hypothetical protein
MSTRLNWGWKNLTLFMPHVSGHALLFVIWGSRAPTSLLHSYTLRGAEMFCAASVPVRLMFVFQLRLVLGAYSTDSPRVWRCLIRRP